MLDLRFDLSDFEQKARELDAALDQVPFALANALTTAAFRAREKLINETWPGHVTVRNRNFLRAVLRIEKATKGNLQVEVYDDVGRANLILHAKGGQRIPHGGHRLTIPPKGAVKRTAHGVAKSQTPRAIIANTPKRALRITPKGIFVGKGGQLHLKYVFKGQARITKDVPFYEDFQRIMREELERAFPITMRNAMRTRRK